MAFESILAQLDAEIARLHQVRHLLSGTGKVEAKISDVRLRPVKLGRPVGSGKAKPKVVKRVLSPEARKAIADAQRKRWAAAKAGKK